MNLDQLRTYAKTFPSQGGVAIGDVLEGLAAKVPPGAAIVEVGSWLGAGTAHLALGQLQSGAQIHVYDRWQAHITEVEKASQCGVALMEYEDTLPMVKDKLSVFDAPINYYKGDIRQAKWHGQPIGLYVDDATKIEEVFGHAVKTFFPFLIPGAHLVLMDYFFFEKGGPRYIAQKKYMEARSGQFELVAERIARTTTAIFRYVGSQ